MMQRFEAGLTPPQQPLLLSRQPAALLPSRPSDTPSQLSPDALSNAITRELTTNLSKMPQQNVRRRKLSVIVIASGNTMKTTDLKAKIDRTNRGEPIVGRLVSSEDHATGIAEDERVRESARSKALNAYKMLRKRKTRVAFSRDYIADKQASGPLEKLRVLVDTIGFSVARRRGNVHILANDVFNARPVMLTDGSVIFERIHKPQTPEEARANLQYLYDFGIQYGQTEVPILTESLTYAFVPNHPQQDAYRTRKSISYLTTQHLGSLLTDEGLAKYSDQLAQDTNGHHTLTSISGGIATDTLRNLGVISRHENADNNSTAFSRDIAGGGFDQELLDTYFATLKPRQPLFGRRKSQN